MYDGKNNPIDKDLAGRVMSLEQRLKGLRGRTAAIEARLSSPGSGSPASLEVPVEDFVPAPGHFDVPAADQQGVPLHPQFPGGMTLPPENIARRQPAKRALDTTGLIAGAILIGAGLLLYAGNVELIKNPVVAIGCGILLVGSVLVRIVL